MQEEPPDRFPMSFASLEAFLERALTEPELRRQLGEAPDAAAVAAIARSVGFPVSERDLWQATEASPDDLPPAPEATAPVAPEDQEVATADTAPGSPLPDPWFPEEPLTRFVHHAQGDPELREALASAPDAAAVASIAQSAGYPISAVDLWLASGTTPDELAASLRPDGAGDTTTETPMEPEGGPVAGPAAAESPEVSLSDPHGAALRASATESVRRLLEQAAADDGLRQALACAPDAAAVAAIAREAGHPIDELALWLASDAAFEEVRPEPEPPALDADPLALFLRAVDVDPDLRLALASAPDAATVAAIARLAGIPLTTADLWAASDAEPRELARERLVLEELVIEQMVIVGP
jgi:predicted ribosomally synthesized peptide with nif11-like leader